MWWLVACATTTPLPGDPPSPTSIVEPTPPVTTPPGTTPPGTTPPGTTPPGTTPAGPADMVWTNAHVVTLDPTSSIATALAALDGVIVWVGQEPVPPEWLGPETSVVDLAGATVLPGLHDVHNHILEAFHPAGGTCLVGGYAPLFTHEDELADCAGDQVGSDWVLGWGFDLWTAIYGPGDTPREVLDAAIPDRPAAIMEASSHAAWVNSAALAELGIDATTPDPIGGVIHKGADGEPDGILFDAAGELAFNAGFALNPEMAILNEDALRLGLAEAARHGVTSLGDGRSYWKRGSVEAWRAIAASGELTLRATVPLWAYPDEDDDVQLATLASMYAPNDSDRLSFSQVKLYADGLTWITTGAMVEPYVGPQFAGPNGLNYFDAARLERYVTELETVGFDMFIHAIGDRGVRETLDAIESARNTNGDLGRRHRVTHVEWIAPEDVSRFAELDVVADIQLNGGWTKPENLHDNDFLVGEDIVDERAYRIRDLYESGARITLSTDYDTASMSLFVGVARAADRGDQSLPSIEAALRAVTTEAAYVLRQEHLTGSLEVGKRADLTVIDRDPFTTSDLEGTVVLSTWVDGDQVYPAL